jgi:cytochrome c oxidase subunit 2
MTPIKTLLVLGLITGLAMYSVPTRAQADSTQVIKITASKFHFTPDHITLEKGQPVTLRLTSSDETHGFMLRALKIDTDINPGKITAITVTPTSTGTFKAICDHYCGLGHGNMKMTVVVE